LRNFNKFDSLNRTEDAYKYKTKAPEEIAATSLNRTEDAYKLVGFVVTKFFKKDINRTGLLINEV
jgi:hypothetical protein